MADTAPALPGLTHVPAGRRVRVRCADPTCGRPVYVDQAVFGYGHCCATKRGLIVHRHRFPARTQTGTTLLDHLEAPMNPTAVRRFQLTNDDGIPVAGGATFTDGRTVTLTVAPGVLQLWDAPEHAAAALDGDLEWLDPDPRTGCTTGPDAG